VIKTRPFREIAGKHRDDPDRKARREQFKRAMADALALAELRQSLGQTQQDLAEKLGVSQPNVSRIEHEEDVYLSTLREYVEALGGRLEITAVFADQVVTLIPGK